MFDRSKLKIVNILIGHFLGAAFFLLLLSVAYPGSDMTISTNDMVLNIRAPLALFLATTVAWIFLNNRE